MLFRGMALALGLFSLPLAVNAQGIESRVMRLPQDIQFTGPGMNQTTVLYGDPSKAGLYVYRTRLSAGSKNLPHWHPEERTVTILSGTLYYSVGEQWDEGKFLAHPPGTFFNEPPKMPHAAWAKDGEVILQVTGIGPTGSTPVHRP